jgi:hypothetical protein
VNPPDAGALNWPMVLDLLDVLEKHGYRKAADDFHVGRAIGLLTPVAEIYAAMRDHLDEVPPVRADGRPAGRVIAPAALRAVPDAAPVPVALAAADDTAEDFRVGRFMSGPGLGGAS